MTTPTESSETILARYAEGPAQLEAALRDLSESDLDLALAADSWSIRQIVHHLADGDDLWKMCIKAALGNSDGLFTLQWYWDKPQTEWVENWKYARRDIRSSLALLRANRQHIMELMQQIPKAWEKSIRLRPPNGQEERVTIGEVVEMQANHIVGHIHDIQSIRQAHHI
jgi:uncharacterized damage-inducible protein DinB